MSNEQRQHIVYEATALICNHLPAITEAFIESTHYRRDNPNGRHIHSNDEIRQAAEALGRLEAKVKELKTG